MSVPESGPPALTFKDVLWLALAVIGLGALMVAGVALADVALAEAFDAPRFSAWVAPAMFLCETLAIFAAVQLLLIRRRGFTWRDLGLRPADPRWLAAGLGGAFLTLLVSELVSNIIDRLTDKPVIERYAELLAPQAGGWPAAAGILLTVGILAPVAEEVFFRGVLYGWLRRRWSAPWSIVVSAAVFALAHGNPWQMVPIFVAGLVLAYLYERSGSLVPAMVTHMTINSASLVAIFAYSGSFAAV